AGKEVWRRVLRYSTRIEQVITVKVEGEPVSDEEVGEALAIILLYVTTLTASTLILTLSGEAIIDALFNSASALGTVGLSTAALTSSAPWWVKLTLTVDMFLGRLEILPVISALTSLRS
ncbi:MAG: TrkH family potassium uptake protein, partial [Desulfurococcales archaeon]|nr:TrkH family potassium uptake protein [Desulfurococcales archaeon]